MSDLIFAGEIDWSCVTDADVGEAMVAYFRQNPQALPKKVKAAIAQAAIMQDQVNRTIEKTDAAERAANFEKWAGLFFESRRSERTREAYEAAFGRLRAFCDRRGIGLSEIEYSDAVDFTLSDELRMGKRGRRGDQSVRLDVAAVSSLYSEMERMSKGNIRNPFLRLATKPGRKRDGRKDVPTAEELDAILANTSGEVRAAIACMAFRGLRIGALPGLSLEAGDGKIEFCTFTKGKDQRGEMPKAAVDAIEAAGLPSGTPFAGQSADALKMKVQRELDRLASDESMAIAARKAKRVINRRPRDVVVSKFSCHSFRHFYAAQEYKKDRDIERVRRLLNHADLNTTQVYLQSLGCIEE